tara:strand:+ start:106 stop:1179 length:1074 start_codon:yes stop_codon:yes gene_type:complete
MNRHYTNYDKGNYNPKKAFTFTEFCSGIGGFRIGLENIGGRVLLSSEIDTYAIQTYKHWFNDDSEGNLFDYKISEIPDHDILTAGFPCQPFSAAGVVSNKYWDKTKPEYLKKKSGFEYTDQKEGGDQGQVFSRLLKIIKGKRPKAIILENVQGLLSHDKGNTWEVIQDELKRAQYDIHFKVINAVHWVPQNRKRIFIVGFDKKQFDTYKDDFFSFPLENQTELKIGSILQKRVKEKYTLKDGTWNSLQTIKKRNRVQKKGFGYSIVDREGPSRTLTKRYFKDGSEILIEQKNKNPRRLTPLEGLRLMGFDQIEKKFKNPDEIFEVSDSQALKLLGNAVVPTVVEAVGREVLRTLENR